MQIDDPVQCLAAAARAAAIDPTRWGEALRLLAWRCRASRAALSASANGVERRFAWPGSFAEPEIAALDSAPCLQPVGAGVNGESRRCCAAEQLAVGLREQVCQPFERRGRSSRDPIRVGGGGYLAAIYFDGIGGAAAPRARLYLLRDRAERAFDDDELDFLRRVQPHLQQAVEEHFAATGATLLPGAVRRALDGLPEPLFVLRADGLIDYENPAAVRARAHAGLLGMRNGRLLGVGGDYRSWAAALRQVVHGTACALPFTHIEEGSVLTGVVRLAPIGDNASYGAAWPTAAVAAAIEFRDERENRAALALFAARHSLTATEVQVLRLLADGRTSREVADRLHIQVSTVRTHLRSLFDKTGLRRQADLVRLLTH